MNIRRATSALVPGIETAAARVQRLLHAEILSGKLAPGTRLIRRDLASRFKVSLSTISDALMRLEQDGIVLTERLYGSCVAPLTIEHVRGDQVLREALECQAARLCADNASRLQFEELREMAEQLDSAMEHINRHDTSGMNLHRRFHVRVAELTGCSQLAEEVDRLWRRRMMLFNWISGMVLPVPANWHQTLVDALASRDPQRAEEAMREHVRWGIAQQISVLKAIEAGGEFPPKETASTSTSA
jgi:DNA-binding GntR family transcriptional regulator